MTDATHDVFISYARTDLDQIAEPIAKILDLAKVSLFLDRSGLLPGADWSADLREAILGARCVLLLGSHDAMASTEVAREVRCASSGGIPIVPILLDGSRPPTPWSIAANQSLLTTTTDLGKPSTLNLILAGIGKLIGRELPTFELREPERVLGRLESGTEFRRLADTHGITNLVATANVGQHPSQAVLTAMENLPDLKVVHLVVGESDRMDSGDFIRALRWTMDRDDRLRDVVIHRRVHDMNPFDVEDDDTARLQLFFMGLQPGRHTWVDVTGGTALMSMVVKQVAERHAHLISYTVTEEVDREPDDVDPLPGDLRRLVWRYPNRRREFRGFVDITTPLVRAYALGKGRHGLSDPPADATATRAAEE